MDGALLSPCGVTPLLKTHQRYIDPRGKLHWQADEMQLHRNRPSDHEPM